MSQGPGVLLVEVRGLGAYRLATGFLLPNVPLQRAKLAGPALNVHTRAEASSRLNFDEYSSVHRHYGLTHLIKRLSHTVPSVSWPECRSLYSLTRALIILQVPGPLDYRKIDAAAGNYRSLRFFALPWRLGATLTSYLMCLLQLRLRPVSQANTNFGRVRDNRMYLFAGLEMDLRHALREPNVQTFILLGC